jgi:hypothetical protein
MQIVELQVAHIAELMKELEDLSLQRGTGVTEIGVYRLAARK